jgi:hypothetical protein
MRHRIQEIPCMVTNAEEAMLQGMYAPAEFARVRDQLMSEQDCLQRDWTALDAEPLTANPCRNTPRAVFSRRHPGEWGSLLGQHRHRPRGSSESAVCPSRYC